MRCASVAFARAFEQPSTRRCHNELATRRRAALDKHLRLSASAAAPDSKAARTAARRPPEGPTTTTTMSTDLVEHVAKRPRTELIIPATSVTAGNAQLSLYDDDDEEEEPRTSGLQAPIMLLTGQEAAVYAFSFGPTGEFAASGGAERAIYLWEVYGDCANYNVLRGHKNAVLELSWLRDGRTLASASADKSVALWDCHAGKRKKKYAGHGGVVNAVRAARSEDTLVSGGDDGCCVLWDARERRSVKTLAGDYAVTAVCFDEDASRVFSGGLEESVKCWDLRMDDVVYELRGHADTITGLSLSPDGTKLLSNAMDAKLHCWDVQPVAGEDRLLTTFVGHQHDFHKNLLRCSWSSDGEKVACGSSDQVVHVWDVATAEELYYLPGHKGSVNEVDFHPKEPILGSASSDKTVYLGEIA